MKTDNLDKVLDEQEGGIHYQENKIQPAKYCLLNHLDFCEGSIVKYVTRWKRKGGIEDLKKARHFLDMLIAHQEDQLNVVKKSVPRSFADKVISAGILPGAPMGATKMV